MGYYLGSRIKEIRKDMKLTQDEFGSRIGIKKSSLSAVENGTSGISDGVLKNIINEFCVNELWLKEGIGEKYNEELRKKKQVMENDLTFMNDELLLKQQIFFNRLKKYTDDAQLEILTFLEEVYSLLIGPGEPDSFVDDEAYFEYIETVAGTICELNRFVSYINTKDLPDPKIIYKYVISIRDDLFTICGHFGLDVDMPTLEKFAGLQVASCQLTSLETEVLNIFRNLDPDDQEEVKAIMKIKQNRKYTSRRNAKSSISGHGEEAATVNRKNLA